MAQFQPEITEEFYEEVSALFELAVNDVVDESEADASPVDVDRQARAKVLEVVREYLEGLTCTEF